MTNLTKKLWLLLVPLLAAGLIAGGLFFFFPPAPSILQPASVHQKKNTKQTITYVALGDSLTEGVGDQTKRGGFVPLVANDLTDRYQLTRVDTENYGVNGERSDQIQKRLASDKKLRKGIEKADIITLTVGGNDLMKVIQTNLLDLNVDSFKKPMASYQKNVHQLLEEMRKLNAEAPIYVLGIYNPFYLNFPEITEMQTIVDDWNKGTEQAVGEEKNSYFIPINDLLYQGLNQEAGITSQDESSDSEESTADGQDLITNNALYEVDHFHPNNLGYQLMANAVRDELIKTHDHWLLKGTK